jgi:hypothetical protein
MRQFWRRWLRSPKYGLARGVAVHGSSGFQKDSARLTDLLTDCPKLRAWAQNHEISLNESPDSLTALDRVLDPASKDMRRALANDCGLYLGTVIVRHQPHARWHVWPNGLPVVRLASGQELDTVAAVHDLGHAGQSHLATLYADAARWP